MRDWTVEDPDPILLFVPTALRAIRRKLRRRAERKQFEREIRHMRELGDAMRRLREGMGE